MIRTLIGILGMAALAGCATVGKRPASAPVEVGIIAINDFHGALEPPKSAVPAAVADGTEVKVPAGGAAYLASAIAKLRQERANSITVSAGDLISASPFVSSQFLDEPTILAMNMIGLDLNAVGNHEFDRGPDELERMQHGGCRQYTIRKPCRLDSDFPGARFEFLAANVRTDTGEPFLSSTALRRFGRATVGFIGLTLKETPTLVVPSNVAKLRFADEAQTINGLIPGLKAKGADAIVVLIHQGLYTEVGYDDKSCGGVSGDLLPILAKLDPAVDLVVSGHTHRAYVCDYGRIDPTRPFLVTSAGRSGTLVTDIRLSIDPAAGRVVAKSADNLIVQGEAYGSGATAVPLTTAVPGYPRDTAVQALVDRYVAAAAPIAGRVVGRMTAPALRATTPSGETALGDLVADAQQRATGADLSFMNIYGLRADLVPGEGGVVTYGQLYSVQPFANVLQVKGLTGRQLRAVLEQQFASGSNTATKPNMLLPSAALTFSYDLSRAAGARIVDLRFKGAPVDDARIYTVALSNFLASGGDNFTVFRDGTDIAAKGIEDVDALEAYLVAAGSVTPPIPNRITRIDAPKP